nr:DUF4277 domain-containing protein [Okeania sp. SIO2B3]
MPDHLGLVAGIIDEIGIVEKINELIEEKKDRESQGRNSSKPTFRTSICNIKSSIKKHGQVFILCKSSSFS